MEIEECVKDRTMTYSQLAKATGMNMDQVKRRVNRLRKEGVVRVEYMHMHGCIKKAAVCINDATLETKRDGALAGAYAVGQTDLDGGMITETGDFLVRKGKAPWMQ